MDRQLIEKYTGTQFNLWDEQWWYAFLNENTGVFTATSSPYLSSKNPIDIQPSTTYYYKGPVSCWFAFYKANGNFISATRITKDRTFTSPANAYKMMFQTVAYASTTIDYRNDICININQPNTSISPHNGEYVPFQQSKNYVVLETCGQVDLGTLNWSYETSTPTYRWASNDLVPLLPTISEQEKPPFECTTYPALAYNDRTGICITAGQSKRIYVFGLDSNTRPSGILTYELANPAPFAIKNVITI